MEKESFKDGIWARYKERNAVTNDWEGAECLWYEKQQLEASILYFRNALHSSLLGGFSGEPLKLLNNYDFLFNIKADRNGTTE